MTDRTETSIDVTPFTPPTEPVEPKPKRKRKSRAKPKCIDPSELVPDLTPENTDTRYWMHVGLRPDFGVKTMTNVALAGQSFPKSGGAIIEKADGSGRMMLPDVYLGAVLALTLDQIHLVAKAVRNRIWRPIRSQKSTVPNGTQDPPISMVTGKPFKRSDPGQGYAWLRVPTPDELKIARESHRVLREFRAQPGDIAAADSVYMRILDEEQPRRPLLGDEIPDPLSVTGVPLPDESTCIADWPRVLPIGKE